MADAALAALSAALGDPAVIVAAGAAAAGAAMTLLAVLAIRPRRGAEVARAVEALGQGQQQLVGALAQLAEAQAVSQARMAGALDERLDRVSGRMGEALGVSATRTARSLGAISERLAAVDAAQERIERLSGEMMGLRQILSNKQARGAFGEVQLEEIVRLALPPDGYAFQATLPNGRRADCLIRVPGPPGALVVDAKFPLEAYEALAAAESEPQRRAARRELGRAVALHLDAIAERYVADEGPADQALMFLPSEAVFAEVHAHHGAVVRRGFEQRVWIVSPGTLMAVLTTLRGVMRDARIREESARIRRELGLIAGDMGRLVERVGDLDRHLGQAQGDLERIRVSAERTRRRAGRLEAVDFPDGSEGMEAAE
jgi:DNA recombination protein RmuC